MKARLYLILALAIMASACAEHFCPAYGSHSSYAYKPAKKKAFKTKSNASSKKVRQAERE